jgi:hypothetical protein
MPRRIVDFSARSEIILNEPFLLHFWESTPVEVLAFLKNPRQELSKMGIDLPERCRVETTIENHDWLSAHSDHLSRDNGTIICGTGGGNTAKEYYKVSFYAHLKTEVGKYEKKLLHSPDQQERSQVLERLKRFHRRRAGNLARCTATTVRRQVGIAGTRNSHRPK